MIHEPIKSDEAATGRYEAPDPKTFLRALYGAAPDELWLELRCIHPGMGEVRRLWSKTGDKPQLASIFQQADALNTEGYGVYFAPCLRSEMKGSADAAAWVPALWIDIDSGGERDLDRLKAFDPPPSFVVASGGGWHGYWLLDEAFQLREDSDREKIASILHGLFAALDGDPGYVKTVAGIMRLPGTVNTKPERNNALVTVVENHPDRRYQLRDFDWLIVEHRDEQIGSMRVVTLDGNGRLPSRTECYVASGAVNGNRNHELFAAACQLRDAGYSQSDVERELIPRYVADGDGSERPEVREKEARSTIASAFSRPPRDPLPPSPQARVASLLDQYDRQERPSTEQITDAVKACAGLNPVEWAEERQRLKSICGDGLKISDLDRLYRDERKRRDREERAAFEESESYAEDDGRMIYKRITARWPIEKAVADWSARVVERVSRVDDDGEVEHVAVVKLEKDDTTATVDVPSEVFGDDAALRRFIAGKAGETFTVRAGMAKHLTPAILGLSGNYPTRTRYRFMGWTQIDGGWHYITPTQSINANGPLDDAHEVDLESRLRDYQVETHDWNDARKAFQAMIGVFPPGLAPALVAFACLPLFQRFFPTAAHKPALHLVGTTGSGKSEIASLMSSLYGQFYRDTPPAQWGDTVNTVEALGNQLADALYWVDDYKHIYADTRTFTRFLQSYSRGMGRGRLTREAKIRQERPCRGHVLSTGETTLEGEPSVLARMIVLDLLPWEGRDPAGQALVKADELRKHLPGFTAHLAAWIASQADAGDLTSTLAKRYEACVAGYRQKLTAAGVKPASTGRIIGNWAVLTTVYQMLGKFLDTRQSGLILPGWRDLAVETAKTMQDERASQLYIDIVQQLVASGRAVIDDPLRPEEHPAHVPVIGYLMDGFAYIIPDIAYREVVKVQPIQFTMQAIGNQLKEDGLLVAGNRNLSTQKRVNGRTVRLWRLKGEVFEGADQDSS